MWRIAKCGVEIFEREMWLRYPRYGKIQHIRMSHSSHMLNFRSAFSINSQFTRSSVTFLLKRSMSQPSDGNSNENKKPKKSFTEIVKENLISLEPDEYTPEPLDSAKMITPADPHLALFVKACCEDEIARQEMERQAESGDVVSLGYYMILLELHRPLLGTPLEESISIAQKIGPILQSKEPYSMNQHEHLILGFILGRGIGQAVESSKAFNYYLLAAEENNPIALENLGFSFYWGLGVMRDRAIAFEYYLHSAKSNYAPSLLHLGFCYDDGQGVTKDISEALRCYTFAANLGCPRALNLLGLRYLDGAGVDKCPAKAIQYFLQSTQKGHEYAHFNLGRCYQDGIGVEKNMKEAIRLYTLAAARGHKLAIKRLEELALE